MATAYRIKVEDMNLVFLGNPLQAPDLSLAEKFDTIDILFAGPGSDKLIKQLAPKLDQAIRRGDYTAFKEILTLAEIVPGSDRYRSLEAEFWRAVAEYRRSRYGLP